MNEPEKSNHWASLAEELGAKADTSPPADPPPSKDVPPKPTRTERKPRSAPRASPPSDWDRLANDLGVAPTNEPGRAPSAGDVADSPAAEGSLPTVAPADDDRRAATDEPPAPDATSDDEIPHGDLPDAAAEGDGAAKTKRRRRRRRRRKSTDESIDSASTLPAGDVNETTVDQPFAESVDARGETSEQDAAADDAGADRKKKRRRRRKRKPSTKADEAPQTDQEAPDEVHGIEATLAEIQTEFDTAGDRSAAANADTKAAADHEDDDEPEDRRRGRQKSEPQESKRERGRRTAATEDAPSTDTPDDTAKKHRSIPAWEEAVGVIIATNMEARKKSSSGPSRRGRRGRGKPPARD